MSIIDAVKRLERSGQEHSKTTEKLREAAREVAGLIIRIVPEGETLPRGYLVVDTERDGLLLVQGVDNSGCPVYINGRGYSGGLGYTPDFSLEPSRDDVLIFARAIANGLIEEIAEWLEQRNAENAEASAILGNTIR